MVLKLLSLGQPLRVGPFYGNLLKFSSPALELLNQKLWLCGSYFNKTLTRQVIPMHAKDWKPLIYRIPLKKRHLSWNPLKMRQLHILNALVKIFPRSSWTNNLFSIILLTCIKMFNYKFLKMVYIMVCMVTFDSKYVWYTKIRKVNV